MISYRSVEKVILPPAPHMVGDGFRVHNFFPSEMIGQKRMSPFYLLDYNSEIEFSPSNNQRGVGVHPHRGFETVTISYKGKIAHRDSLGNEGVINDGDVQWMTAASGVLHKEFHEEGFSKTGGPFQMVQLWVNLPAKHKMSLPKYQAIKNEQIPIVDLAGKGKLEIIAGKFNDQTGAASTFTPINIFNIYLKKGATLLLDMPANFNTGLLVVKGDVSINEGSKVETNSFILFENEEGPIKLEAQSDGIFLLLSGQPIDEPLAAYGPFLMNTHKELEEALNDYSRGKFGILE